MKLFETGSIDVVILKKDNRCHNLHTVTEIKVEDIQCIPVGITVKTEQKKTKPLAFVVEFLLIQITLLLLSTI